MTWLSLYRRPRYPLKCLRFRWSRFPFGRLPNRLPQSHGHLRPARRQHRRRPPFRWFLRPRLVPHQVTALPDMNRPRRLRCWCKLAYRVHPSGRHKLRTDQEHRYWNGCHPRCRIPLQEQQEGRRSRLPGAEFHPCAMIAPGEPVGKCLGRDSRFGVELGAVDSMYPIDWAGWHRGVQASGRSPSRTKRGLVRPSGRDFSANFGSCL
jgi:hypothetical protein